MGDTEGIQSSRRPRAGTDDGTVTTAQAPPLRADGTPLRALVVDDEADLADVLTNMLLRAGWASRSAHDGRTAVELAESFQPDAVVLDINLPDIAGFEVLRRMRTLNPSVCVLFLTARDAVEDRIAGITAGADDYVTKPFSMEEVLARLRGLAATRRTDPPADRQHDRRR